MSDEHRALAADEIGLPRVRFVCRSSNHQSEVALMDFVRVNTPSGGVVWNPKVAGSNEDRHKRIGQFLDGNRRLSKKEYHLLQRGLYEAAGDVIRMTYRFECAVCGETRSMRDDRLVRVLEQLVSGENATFDISTRRDTSDA